MIDPFAKAERWRSRAAELRTIATGLHEHEARAGLLAIADGLDHHARALTNMAVILHCTAPVFRECAADVVAEAAD